MQKKIRSFFIKKKGSVFQNLRDTVPFCLCRLSGGWIIGYDIGYNRIGKNMQKNSTICKKYTIIVDKTYYLKRSGNLKYKKSVYRALALITQVGISMLAPVFMCAFLGVYLDGRFGGFWTLPLFVLGCAAGFRNCYILTKKANEDKSDRKGSGGLGR